MSKKLVDNITTELQNNPFDEDCFSYPIVYIHADSNSDITDKITGIYGKERIYFADYGALFADYKDEPVIVFNNFYSSIPLGYISTLLNQFTYVPTRYGEELVRSRYLFVVSDIPLDEQYPEFSHVPDKNDFWKCFVSSFNIVVVCQDGSAQIFSTGGYFDYLREMHEQEDKQRKLKTAIEEYKPDGGLSRHYNAGLVLHCYQQNFGLYIKDTGSVKGTCYRYNGYYCAVDRAGNVVIDNVTMDYLAGLLAYMKMWD